MVPAGFLARHQEKTAQADPLAHSPSAKYKRARQKANLGMHIIPLATRFGNGVVLYRRKPIEVKPP